MPNPQSRYYVLILQEQEEQRTQPLRATEEKEACQEAAALVQTLDREGTIVLFREKKPNPLMAWKRLANGSVIEGRVKAE